MKRLLLIPIFILLCGVGAVWSQNQADFYDTKTIQTVNITFQEKNWRDILDSLRYNGDELLTGMIEINKQKFENAGIRYRSARGFQIGGKHNSLYIKLPEGKNYQGYGIVELSNAVRDPSVVREVLASEIARKYMPVPKANYAKVMINGNYYGFFVNIESVDGKFLENNFGDKNGDLFYATIPTKQAVPDGCDKKAFANLKFQDDQACYTYGFDRVNKRAWSSVMELSDILTNRPENVENILDVDRTLWMLAFNNVIVNLNSYTGHPSTNYYLYKDPDGKFVPILGDLNFAFGSFKNTDGSSDLDDKGLIMVDPLLHADNPDRPLISKLLSNELYRKMYLSHMRTILYDNFTKGQFEKRAKELQTMIQKVWLEDPNKEYNATDFQKSLTTTVGQRSRIPGLSEFMNLRADYLQQTPEMAVVPPSINNVQVVPREKFSPTRVETFKVQAKVGDFPRKVYVYYRFDEKDAFTQVEMLDNGSSADEKAGDEIFGTEIKPAGGAKKIEYYVVAENAKTVNFSPSLYMYERHQANLDDLNK